MINDEEISVCFLNSNNYNGSIKEEKGDDKAKDKDANNEDNKAEGVADDISVKEEGDGEIITKENDDDNN